MRQIELRGEVRVLLQRTSDAPDVSLAKRVHATLRREATPRLLTLSGVRCTTASRGPAVSEAARENGGGGGGAAGAAAAAAASAAPVAAASSSAAGAGGAGAK